MTKKADWRTHEMIKLSARDGDYYRKMRAILEAKNAESRDKIIKLKGELGNDLFNQLSHEHILLLINTAGIIKIYRKSDGLVYRLENNVETRVLDEAEIRADERTKVIDAVMGYFKNIDLSRFYGGWKSEANEMKELIIIELRTKLEEMRGKTE